MADDQILHYLPPGWTEEMYQNQTDAALETLSEQVRGHITKSKREENKIYSELLVSSVQSPGRC
jgi:ferritin-like protein